MAFDYNKAFTVDENGVSFTDTNTDFTANVSANTIDPTVTGRTAPISSLYLRSNGDAYIKVGPAATDWKRFAKGNFDPEDIFYDMKEPTGHLDRTDSDIAFNDSTREFSIAPLSPATEFVYYIRGVLYTITSTQTVTLPNTTGLYFIYFDTASTLQYQTTFTEDLLTEKAITGIVYFNTATGQKGIYVADERHGLTMDGATHFYLHTTRGAVWLNGLALQNFVIDGTGNLATNAQYSVSDGKFRDEDLEHDVYDTGGGVNPYDLEQPLSPVPAQIPVYYRLGSNGDWYKKPADNFPLIYSGDGSGYVGGSGLPPWNEYTGSTWQLTEVGNNRYVFMHIFAVNDINNPIIAVQGIVEHQNKPQGQREALTEIQQLQGLPFAEFVPLGSVIYQVAIGYANTPKARTRSTDDGDDYVDWRTVDNFLYLGGGAGSGVTSFSAGTTGFTPSTASTGAITLAGTLIAANGGTGFNTYAQGDILYADTTTTLAKLAKDTNATRYLSNTGASNNPAWAQIDLTNGVTGTLPLGNGGTGTTTGLRLNNIIAANGSNSINNGDNAQTWNWQLTTAAKSAFTFGENTASTNGAGAQYLVDIKTVASSTAAPLRVQARGADELLITPLGSMVLGSAALTTSATDGFLYIEGMAGHPTGVPTTFTGRTPITFDQNIPSLWAVADPNADNSWRPVSEMHHRRVVSFVDEFALGSTTDNNIGDLRWNMTQDVAATNTIQASVTDHPGIIRLVTSTTNGNETRIHFNNTTTGSSIMANQTAEFTWIVRVPTITSIRIKLGIAQDAADDTAGTFGTNGVWFEFVSAANANWRCYTRSGGTSSTALNTTVAVVANDWYVLRAVRNGTANWEFFVNDVSRGTITTNLPTTAVNVVAIVATATNAARNLDIDYFSLVTEVMGNRYT